MASLKAGVRLPCESEEPSPDSLSITLTQNSNDDFKVVIQPNYATNNQHDYALISNEQEAQLKEDSTDITPEQPVEYALNHNGTSRVCDEIINQ